MSIPLRVEPVRDIMPLIIIRFGENQLFIVLARDISRYFSQRYPFGFFGINATDPDDTVSRLARTRLFRTRTSQVQSGECPHHPLL